MQPLQAAAARADVRAGRPPARIPRTGWGRGTPDVGSVRPQVVFGVVNLKYPVEVRTKTILCHSEVKAIPFQAP